MRTVLRPHATLGVARAVVRAWRNTAVRAVGGHGAVLIAAAAVALLFALIYVVLGLQLLGPLFVHEDTQIAQVRGLTAAALSNVFVLVCLLLSVFITTSPSQNALGQLVAFTPLRTAERVAGSLLPIVTIVLAVGVVIAAPVAIAVAMRGGAWAGLFSLAVIGAQLAIQVLAAIGIFHLVSAAIVRVVSLGARSANMIAMATLMCLSGAGLAVNIAPARLLEGHYTVHPANMAARLVAPDWSGLGAAAVTGRVAGGLALTALACALALGFAVTGLAIAPEDREARGWRLLHRLPVPARPLWRWIAVEAKQTCRRPDLAVTVTIFGALATILGALGATGHLDIGSFGAAVAAVVWLMAALTAEGAYGRTKPWRWLIQSTPVRAVLWVVAHFGVMLATAVAVSALLFAAIAALGTSIGWTAWLSYAPAGVVLTVAVAIAGTIIPSSTEHPFSSVLTLAAALLMTTPLLLVLAAVGFLEETAITVAITGATLLLGPLAVASLDKRWMRLAAR